MTADLDDEKIRIWEEIRHLSHIGRSINDIEQTLTAKGYDRSLLKEILTFSYMETLMEKEERFVDMIESKKNQVARNEKEDHETLRQKSQEEQIQKQKQENEEALLVEEEKIRKDAEEELRRTDIANQERTSEYSISVKEEEVEARQQKEIEDKKQEQEGGSYL